MVEVKIVNEKLKELPKYATSGSAGLDLVACIDKPIKLISQDKAVLIPSGIALNMQTYADNIAAVLLPRSGLGHKKGLVLGNTIGLIDKDYQGEIFISAWNRNTVFNEIVINPMERIAQLVFIPILKPHLELVKEFSEITARNSGGFGSTGV